jgi:nitroreductase
MDAIQALKTRHSVRAYTDEGISRTILEDIVDCGRLAATAINIQPWEFVVVTERQRLRRIAEIADHGKFIAGAAACVVVLSKETKYYLEDGSAATQNMLVAARAHGLGACWVAGDKKPYAPEIVAAVGAPAGYKLISLVALGHPRESSSQPKRHLEEVLHWEKF